MHLVLLKRKKTSPKTSSHIYILYICPYCIFAISVLYTQHLLNVCSSWGFFHFSLFNLIWIEGLRIDGVVCCKDWVRFVILSYMNKTDSTNVMWWKPLWEKKTWWQTWWLSVTRTERHFMGYFWNNSTTYSLKNEVFVMVVTAVCTKVWYCC